MNRKHIFLTAVLFALGVLAVTPAFAQPDQMIVNIPFQFTVRDQVMPEGRYLIQALDERSSPLMAISNMRTGKEVFFLTESVNPKPYEQRSDLVFRQLNGQNVLTQLWLADNHSASWLMPIHR